MSISTSFVNRVIPSLPRLGRLIRAFGVMKGVRTCVAMKRGADTVRIPLPGPTASQRSVHLRPHTSDIAVFDQVFLERLYDGCVDGDVSVVVDAGAHIGCSSLFFAQTFPAAQIVAVEPELSNYELLCLNTAHEPRIRCVHAALWSEDGELDLRADSTGSTWGHTVVNSTESGRPLESSTNSSAVVGEGRKVRAVCVETLLRESNCKHVDLFKIDIEGAERAVFGTEELAWLSKVRSLVIELHERMYPGCATIVDRALEGYSGKVTLLDE